MKHTYSMTAIALTGLMGVSILSPIAAGASEQGKRNTAIGLGAVAAALLLTQKNKLPGVLAAGGAAYAYSQYDKDVKARHNREQYGDYYYDGRNQRQNDGYRYHDNNNGYNQTNGYNRYNHNQNSGFNQSSDYRYHQDNNQNYGSNSRYNSQSGCGNRSAHPSGGHNGH